MHVCQENVLNPFNLSEGGRSMVKISVSQSNWKHITQLSERQIRKSV